MNLPESILNASKEAVQQTESISNATKAAVQHILPDKSHIRYVTAYEKFAKWQESQNTNSFDEDVLLAYFGEAAKAFASSTLWSMYSMLKTTINCNHTVNIGEYTRLTAFLRNKNNGFNIKKSTIFHADEIRKFLMEAPNLEYLAVKVVAVFAISSGCCGYEITNVRMDHVKDYGTEIIVRIPDFKSKGPKVYAITDEFAEIVRNYIRLRPSQITTDRFFIQYRGGKCTVQVMGKHAIAKIPRKIAEFLGLPNPEGYTGRSFRSSTTILTNTGGSIETVKRDGVWKSSKVAEGYTQESLGNKRKICETITSANNLDPIGKNGKTGDDDFDMDSDDQADEEYRTDGKKPKVGVTSDLKHLDGSFNEAADEIEVDSKFSISMSTCSPSDLNLLATCDLPNSGDDKSMMACSSVIQELAKKKLEILLQSPSIVEDFFGLDYGNMSLVDMIADEGGIKKDHVLICLQKIKQNMSFNVLGFDYGMSKTDCETTFYNTISVVANALKKFLVWSDLEFAWHRLPIASRTQFSNVISIIHCLEIEIQQPNNPVHQADTWSECKKCNTVKFIVSLTPEGIVNYISEGFGGQITDVEIVKSSRYLTVLPSNSVVMADRGFKNIETILQEKGCRLVHFSSEGEPMSKDQLRLTKLVAAVRIHIERVIRRYSEFAILRPHATVNTRLFATFNEIVNVVSALINVQNAVIK